MKYEYHQVGFLTNDFSTAVTQHWPLLLAVLRLRDLRRIFVKERILAVGQTSTDTARRKENRKGLTAPSPMNFVRRLKKSAVVPILILSTFLFVIEIATIAQGARACVRSTALNMNGTRTTARTLGNNTHLTLPTSSGVCLRNAFPVFRWYPEGCACSTWLETGMNESGQRQGEGDSDSATTVAEAMEKLSATATTEYVRNVILSSVHSLRGEESSGTYSLVLWVRDRSGAAAVETLRMVGRAGVSDSVS